MAPETPKGVSSRLLTMKFMQRAAASASSAGSPDSEAPSSKKRKLEHSPAQGCINLNIDQALIQAALDQEEATRQTALERHSTTDTHWVLDNQWSKAKPTRTASNPLNVVYVGYGDFDSANESGDNEDVADKGRTSTKPPPPTTKKGATSQGKDGDESDSDEESSNEHSSSDDEGPRRKRRKGTSGDNTPPSRDRSRSQSRSRHNAEGIKAKEFRDKRKKKEVRINQLTSISGGGGTMSSNRSMKCYTCQQVGHKASDCPQRPQRRK
ncbi:hypothetical protein JDV02_001047 [Purpureocillium takamizusanense]|uniref:CCHC-type domain-containing protein n=1 Tax=Purpureocillium takamizusanense TaxID=2060973 RepID=A0A9Q8V730_9HYPO|nr:uncharacterized protein JDV02_001047 [Purpureocillium takamizusanense]UNI14417.1 hypothetical protein JDV02_001047 [Purpureocillium takamizusanense]